MDREDAASIGARFRALEWNVQRLLGQTNLTWEDPPDQVGPTAEISQLVQAGKKLEAIKAYRALTGVGLAEAKAVIDTM